MLPWHTKVEILGLTLPWGRVTVYGMTVMVGSSGSLQLHHTEHTWWQQAHFDPQHLSPAILELAAGFGGMGIGVAFLGGQPTVSIDITELSVAHLKANQHGQAYKIDLHSPTAARDIHQRCPPVAHTACLGFPCQPYSSQGMELHTADTRAQTLSAGLHTIWHLQCQSAILECVCAAGKHQSVLTAIQSLADAMDWDFTQVTLDLQDQWPSRRKRWWALLLPRQWNAHGLHPWPKDPTFSTVGHILPSWGIWDETSEQQLQLTCSELTAYHDPRHGSDKRVLEQQDVCPTILHSYANALGPCPCSCRDRAFSNYSLTTKGLRGFTVPSQVHGNPRFLHHREAAALLGVPESVTYTHDSRANLSLLGLIASPIQAVWIYGTLAHNFATATHQNPPVHPIEAVQAYKQEICRQLDKTFPFSNAQPRYITLTNAEGTPLHIISPMSNTIGHLLHAERINLSWGSGIKLRDQHGRDPHTRLDLRWGPYSIDKYDKHHPKEAPHGVLLIQIEHKGATCFHCADPGQFIFEVLQTLDIQHIQFLSDDTGRVYGADFRLWRSITLHTLSKGILGIPRGFTEHIHARGHGSDSHEGLSEHTIQQVTWQLLHHSTGPKQSVARMLTPREAHKLIIHDDKADLEDGGRFVCIFPHEGHWALLTGTRQITHIHWTYWDGLPYHAQEAAQTLADRWSTATPVQSNADEVMHSSTHGHVAQSPLHTYSNSLASMAASPQHRLRNYTHG